jgi:hypothetical protein
MVILFPSNIQSRNGARPTMPKIVPVKEQHIWPQTVFCPPINYTTSVSMQPPPCTPLPRIVQVPGQISIRKNVPVTVHVLKFSLALNTTVRAPTPNTVNMVIQPKSRYQVASKHALVRKGFSGLDTYNFIRVRRVLHRMHACIAGEQGPLPYSTNWKTSAAMQCRSRIFPRNNFVLYCTPIHDYCTTQNSKETEGEENRTNLATEGDDGKHQCGGGAQTRRRREEDEGR